MDVRFILGQLFRDYTGMPTKVTSYNTKLSVYGEISNDISEVEEISINFLEESGNGDWRLIEAKKIKLEYDLASGIISADDYVLLLNDLDKEKKHVLNDFVSTTNQYFVTAYRNNLNSIKKKNNNDPYISLMKFDTWFDMEEARELADFAALQIRSSDKYVDAERIAEIRNKYLYERHIRRGR